MGLFSKKPNADKLLNEALSDYKQSKYQECYQKVCEAAELKSSRAYFCKALLIYNDHVSLGSEPDFNVLDELLKHSLDGGYTLAYGFYAYILYAMQYDERLCDFLSSKGKVKDGLYLTFYASYLFGLYTDEEHADIKTTIAIIKESISLLTNFKNQLSSGKKIEYEESELYNPYSKLSIDYTYPHAHFLLLTALYCENDWDKRKEFMDTFKVIIDMMPLAEEKFRASKQYMRAILNNYLGMRDLSEANKTMKIINDCFNGLNDEDKDYYKGDYNQLYDDYNEFYQSEIQKLKQRDITYSDGYADKNALSLNNIVNAISQGAKYYANSSSKSTTTVYTINGKKYTRGELGYLYDEQGIKGEYRIDDYSRLHDENGRELGYFNKDGLFIDS